MTIRSCSSMEWPYKQTRTVEAFYFKRRGILVCGAFLGPREKILRWVIYLRDLEKERLIRASSIVNSQILKMEFLGKTQKF